MWRWDQNRSSLRIEAFLNTFETAVEAHDIQRDKQTVILALQLTGKAYLAYAAMSDHNAKDYDRVNTAIFYRYNIMTIP